MIKKSGSKPVVQNIEMKFYPKKLRNIEDLEREKRLLLRQQQQLEEEDILSLDGIFGKKGDKEDDKHTGSILDFLPISNPILDVVIKIAQRWFTRKSEAAPKHARPSSSDEGRGNETCKEKKDKSPLRAIAVEVIGGYLKWKAVELSFKGIRHIIKTRREHKKEQ